MAQDRVLIQGRTPAGQPVALCLNASGQLCLQGLELDVNIVGGQMAGMVDDSPFIVEVDDLTPIGALLDDIATDTVDEDDIGVLRMSSNRSLYVMLRDAAGNERGLNVDAAGNIAVTDGGLSLTVDDGGLTLSVDDAGGTLTVDDGGLTLSVDDAGGTLTVDAPAGAPVAIASLPRAAIVRVTGTVAGAGVNALVAAPGVGVRIIVRYFIIQNESAVATQWYLRDGAVNVIRYYGAAAGSGLAGFFTAGDDWELALNTALNLWLSGANIHNYSIGYWVE